MSETVKENWIIHDDHPEWGITITHHVGGLFWGTICIGTHKWMKLLVDNPTAPTSYYARFKSRADAEEAVERLKKGE